MNTARDPVPSISLGPISSPLMWPPSIPVVAAVEWRAPELKPESEWSVRTRENLGSWGGFFAPTHNLRISSLWRFQRVSVRVSP